MSTYNQQLREESMKIVLYKKRSVLLLSGLILNIEDRIPEKNGEERDT